MKYRSTRGGGPEAGLGDALAAGLAADGGLYVPVELPSLTDVDFAGDTSLPTVALRLLAPFLAGDPLAGQLGAICAEAFTFAAPLKRLATPDDQCAGASLADSLVIDRKSVV